jgi:hypothetical protein
MEAGCMSTINEVMKKIAKLGLLLMTGVGMSAGAGLLGLGGMSWKEEVLLHDGSKIIADRSVELGGRHELGQKPPIKEQSLTFTLPSNKQRVIWQDHYSEDVGSSNFNPLLLEIVNGTAYVLVSPAGCLSYNKWGRPNPPYVVFKYQGKEWKRVSLQELPVEIKLPNIVISSPDDVAKNAKNGLLSVEMIKQANAGFGQPQYRTILREAIANAGGSRCGEMVPYGKGGWLGLDWFSDQPTYEACSKFCETKGVSPQNCPCASLFKGK